MKNIETMEDWDILMYLRTEREWMVQSHYAKEDIEHLMRRDFKDAQEWKEFTYHACNEFDRIKESAMIHIINSYLAEIYRDQDYVFNK